MGKRAPVVVVWDNTDALSWIWRLGSTIDRTRHSYGVASWEEAIQVIDMVYASFAEPVDVQVWGHGNDGRVYIAGHHLPLDAFADVLQGKVRQFWARSCETIRGSVGKKWALSFVRATGATYIGHAVVTNAPNPLWQGRCAALKPRQLPWWADDGSDLKGCLTTRMKPPKHAFRD